MACTNELVGGSVKIAAGTDCAEAALDAAKSAARATNSRNRMYGLLAGVEWGAIPPCEGLAKCTIRDIQRPYSRAEKARDKKPGPTLRRAKDGARGLRRKRSVFPMNRVWSLDSENRGPKKTAYDAPHNSACGRRLGERQDANLHEQGGIIRVDPALNRLAVPDFNDVAARHDNAFVCRCDSQEAAFM